MDLKIVNLHPELTIEANAINDPLYFPSISFMVRQNEKGKDGMAMFQDAQQCCILYQQQWDEVNKDLRYLKEQRWQLLEPVYGKEKQQAEHKILMRVFDAADYFLQGRWSVMADQVLDVVGTAYQHSDYNKLRHYLLGYKEEFSLQQTVRSNDQIQGSRNRPAAYPAPPKMRIPAGGADLNSHLGQHRDDLWRLF